MGKVAIIGAGISGLTCGELLQQHGHKVTIFEKSRGVGGRMSTRRTPEGVAFDHGAQYFTVRDKRFAKQVESWQATGLVAAWQGRIVSLHDGVAEPKDGSTRRYVGVPRMNSPCRQLAENLDIRTSQRVEPPSWHDDHWHLRDEHGQTLGEFDWFISSAPAAQTAALLHDVPTLAAVANRVEMQPCWAVMLQCDARLPLDFDGAFVQQSALSWIARNSAKPERPEHEAWTLHASPDWSMRHLGMPREEVVEQLLACFWRATGLPAESNGAAVAHFWRYAIPAEPLSQSYLLDTEKYAAACGDWCGGPRVEGAYLSGVALAEAILNQSNE